MMIHEPSFKPLTRSRRITIESAVALLAVLLSLISMTVLLPAGFHLPW
ncbi:MAG TPA: hypothetical protein VFB34_03290 [Chloroflexota bacterium]|nr:hypothetical protein [Chloroflexota bacterium]